MLQATLLKSVPADANVNCQEAFGPVALLAVRVCATPLRT